MSIWSDITRHLKNTRITWLPQTTFVFLLLKNRDVWITESSQKRSTTDGSWSTTKQCNLKYEWEYSSKLLYIAHYLGIFLGAKCLSFVNCIGKDFIGSEINGEIQYTWKLIFCRLSFVAKWIDFWSLKVCYVQTTLATQSKFHSIVISW